MLYLDNGRSDTKRGAGIAILNFIGQCGPLLGTRIYPDNQAPNYTTGMAVCAGFMFFTSILGVLLRQLLVWENKRLDEKYGESRRIAEASNSSKDNDTAVEDEGPGFRFVL